MTKPKRKSVKKSDRVQPMRPGLNGGMIRHGSLPGNTPGTGRPPDVIRALQRKNLREVIPILHARFLEGSVDAVRYAQYLSEYVQKEGAISHDEYERRIGALIEVVKRYVPQPAHEALVHDLNSVHQMVLEETA